MSSATCEMKTELFAKESECSNFLGNLEHCVYPDGIGFPSKSLFDLMKDNGERYETSARNVSVIRYARDFLESSDRFVNKTGVTYNFYDGIVTSDFKYLSDGFLFEFYCLYKDAAKLCLAGHDLLCSDYEDGSHFVYFWKDSEQYLIGDEFRSFTTFKEVFVNPPARIFETLNLAHDIMSANANSYVVRPYPLSSEEKPFFIHPSQLKDVLLTNRSDWSMEHLSMAFGGDMHKLKVSICDGSFITDGYNDCKNRTCYRGGIKTDWLISLGITYHHDIERPIGKFIQPTKWGWIYNYPDARSEYHVLTVPCVS